MPTSSTTARLGGLLKAEDVAEMLGVPKTWVYARSREGTLPTVRMGHYVRYRPEAVAEWIAKLESAAR